MDYALTKVKEYRDLIFTIASVSSVIFLPYYYYSQGSVLEIFIYIHYSSTWMVNIMTTDQNQTHKMAENSSRKEMLRVLLSVFIILAGTLHFITPDPFVKIVPSSLSHPLALVYISGVCEILGGLGLLLPPVSQAAAWGLILLFIAVFPANINMAVNQIDLPGIPDSSVLRWGRLPLQAVLIAWAGWYMRPDNLEQQASLLPRGWVKVLRENVN